MTVSNTLFEKHVQPSSSVPVTIALGFEVFDSSEIVAFFDGASVTAGFTVDTVANTVTFQSSPGFDSSKNLILRRVCAQTQSANLINNQTLDVEAVETALDKVTALAHQGMTINNDGELDASKLVDTTVTARRITNVADGVAPTDAATVGQLVGGTGTFVNSIAGEGGTLLTGAITLDTDDVAEGSSNLYHTTARAAAAAPVQTVTSTGSSITVTQPSTGTFNVEVTNQNTGGTVPAASGSDKFIVTSSGAYVLESGATARTSLGVGSGDNVTFNDVTAGRNLAVTGTSTLGGAVTANGGVTSSGTIQAEQLTTTDDLTVAADASVGAALAVTGTTTLTGALKGATSNRVGVNIASASADGMLHVQEASAGSVTALTTGNLLVLETNDTSNGLTILQPNPSGSDNTANIFFGKVADEDSGGIVYTHNQTNRNQDSLALNFGGSTATFDANGGSPQLVLPSTTIIDNVANPTANDHAANKVYVDAVNTYVDGKLPTTSNYPYAVFHTSKLSNKTFKTYSTFNNAASATAVNSFNSLDFDTALDRSGTTDIALSGDSGITIAANGIYKVEFFGQFSTVQDDFTFAGNLTNPYLALVDAERNAANSGTLITIGQSPVSTRVQDNGTGGSDLLSIPNTTNDTNTIAMLDGFSAITVSDILVTSGSSVTFFPTIVCPVQGNAASFSIKANGVLTVQRLDVVR